MAKDLLLVGAGHAHLTILKNLRVFSGSGHHVTVINAGKYHYYSGMGPGMLSETYAPGDIRFHVEKMVTDQGGNFIQDKFVGISPQKQTIQTQSGKSIPYDVISFNIGSYVPFPDMKKSLREEKFVFPVKPIENLLMAKNKILSLLKRKKPAVLVVGGGAAGVEIAANVCALADKHKKAVDITLVTGEKLLNRFNEPFRAKAKAVLKKYRINLLEQAKVDTLLNQCARLNTGVNVSFDIAFWAAGILPSSSLKNSGLPTGADGGLMVNEYLQCVSFPNIFGGGDCISFQGQNLDKVGVYAVRQNPVLFENLKNFLDKKPLKPFVPQNDYMVIFNMGNNEGILKWKNFTYRGKGAFCIKNFIDQRFMKTFQISDERDPKNAALHH